MTDYVAKYEAASTAALTDNSSVVVPLMVINRWVLTQRKVTGGTESFNKTWAEYRDGFGSASGDDKYWLGLDKIYHLVQLGSLTLRVEVNVNELYSQLPIYMVMLNGKLCAAVSKMSVIYESVRWPLDARRTCMHLSSIRGHTYGRPLWTYRVTYNAL